MCCCEYQLVLSGEERCHGDCYILSLEKSRQCSDSFATDSMERIWTSYHNVSGVLKSNDNNNNGNLPGPYWQILGDPGALGGVPLVYCYADVVSEHPFWLCVCLSFCVSVCSCSMLCSLAEDEVKTESDVVEGMDASVRSKGKSLRPSCSR